MSSIFVSSGRDVTFEAGMGRSGDGWRVGDTVSVRYRLDQPEIAEIDSIVALWAPAALFGLLAVVFVSVGISLWFGVIPV